MARAIEHHQPPAFFASGPSPFAKLIFFIALSIAVMAIDARFNYLANIRQGFITAIQPLQAIANAPSKAYYALKEQLVTHQTLLKDNQAMKQSAMHNAMALQQLNAVTAENNRLRHLLGAANSFALHSQLAEIVHIGRDPFVRKVIVNIGSSHNIVPGQAVMDDLGVIGQVTEVYAQSSEVTLLTDKSLSIPVQVERNGLRAIAFGHSQDTTLDLPYLPANVDIKENDTLVTSGIDGIYPAGLAVARVVKITHNADSPFAHIICQPVGGIENHKQLLILDIPKPQLPEPLPVEPITAGKPVANQAKNASETLPKKALSNAIGQSIKTSPPTTNKPPAPKIVNKPEGIAHEAH